MMPKIEQPRSEQRRRRNESGMALVLALVSLLLLTFLGLTLAASTSTELQIAANYRWSQMALYNALAGLDAARSGMAKVQNWATLVQVRTGVSWSANRADFDEPPASAALDSEERSHEQYYCDYYGNGMGYGRVLDLSDSGGVLFQNRTSYLEQPIQGSFTVWVRRPVEVNNSDGTLRDRPGNVLVVTAEGVAPATAGNIKAEDLKAANSAVSASNINRAVRLVEATFYASQGEQGQGCGGRTGQTGGGAAGNGAASCPTLGDGTQFGFARKE